MLYTRCGWMTLLSAAGIAAAAGVAQAQEPGHEPTKPAQDETKSDQNMVESQVHFAFNSATLSAKGKAELDEAVKWLRENEAAGLILIEGYADKVGGAPYNKELGEKRAETARAYLLQQGVTAAQIKVISYGEALPEDETEGPSRLNRRIVLMAVQKDSAAEAMPPQAEPVEKEEVFIDRAVEVEVPVAPRMLGIDVLAGGGVTAFLDDHTENVTDPGGMWTARLVAGTRSRLAFEAAYVGSTQNLDMIGLDSNAQILGNGVEGNLRWNLMRESVIQPFLYAGLGWTHYIVSNSDIETASIDDEDDVVQVPAGAGLAFRFGQRISLDLRGTYRWAEGDGMFQGGPGDEGEGDGLESLSGTAQLGFGF